MLEGLEGAAGRGVLLAAVAGPPAAAAALALGGRVLPARWDAIIPLAALPALVASALAPAAVAIPWLFLGAELAIDRLGASFLFAIAAVWLLAGFYALGYLNADPRRRGFFLGFGLALAGAVGTVSAADAVSFYVFFNVSTFASYVMIAHERDARALRAGRIYVAMALAGDVVLFAGLVWLVFALGELRLAAIPGAVAAADGGGALAALFFFGFGIKAGAIGVHMWLPLAHPAAPTPASAVLSGAVIKLGLLGWLRFLPLGHEGAAPLGAWAAASGAVAVFGAAIAGALQRDAKTALAYSSVSQIGLVAIVVGAALARPERAEAAAAAAALFAIHHALAKSTLFFGVGALRARLAPPVRAVSVGAVAFAAAALAGAPLTTGAIAKKAIDAAVPDGTGFWLLGVAVTLSSAATATLLIAVGSRLRAELGAAGVSASRAVVGGLWAGAAALAGAVWLAPAPELAPLARESMRAREIAGALWPIALGVAAAGAAILAGTRAGWSPRVPPGDVIVWLEAGWGRIRARVEAASGRLSRRAERARARRGALVARARSAVAAAAGVEDRAATFVTGAAAAVTLVWLFAILLAGR